MKGSKKNLAVFFSGYGSNLNIFLQNKSRFGHLLAVSSNPDAYGVERAKAQNVECLILPKPIDWESLHDELIQQDIQLLFLAGFLKILPAPFVEKWPGRIFNLHPSKLPDYKGLNSIEKAYQAGDNIGVTIHQVVAELDSGPIVAQQIAVTKKQIPKLSLEEATQKTHECEHQMVQAWIDTLETLG